MRPPWSSSARQCCGSGKSTNYTNYSVIVPERLNCAVPIDLIMNRWEYALLAGLFIFGLAIGFMIPREVREDRNTVYQVSTIDALLQGSYDGVVPFTEIKRHGDFGIATFDSLDGEMVAVDGEFYQVKADGSVVPVTDAMTSPFGTVTFFSPDISFILPTASNFSEFSVLTSSLLPSRNLFYAVRIRGEIPYVKARSIPHQEKPYPRLMDAAANQSVFEFNNTTGIVVGFYTPSMAEGLNVPGYHLHYISADRTKGGHILDFRLENATVELDTIPRFIMDLPPQGSFLSVDLSENLSNELAVVEQGSR